ncbi:hypothetical protein CFK39_04975 [Brachybacterium avium]|uniref:Uncharacterized protein n=1 Tax=Brachybacterium avium TaxID=2017485 RepID=A0A220UBK7_9MICO|nr:hypothetical protein [Brachybacterium avium]ASK65292.1 hypothetical protein CFK39_04975 [Brachybacterium avium]
MTQPPQSSSGPLSPQNAAYGQGGVPSPGFAPAPAKKPSKAPKVLIVLGSVILALSVIIGVVLAVIGFGGTVSGMNELEVFDSGNGTVTAEAGESLQIYAEEGAAVPSCTIDGPAVGPGTGQSSTMGDGEHSWVSVDSFTAEEAGDYEVSCTEAPIAVGPPVSIGGIFAGLGGIALAIFGGALGLLLLVIGVVLLIVRKRSA